MQKWLLVQHSMIADIKTWHLVANCKLYRTRLGWIIEIECVRTESMFLLTFGTYVVPYTSDFSM